MKGIETSYRKVKKLGKKSYIPIDSTGGHTSRTRTQGTQFELKVGNCTVIAIEQISSFSGICGFSTGKTRKLIILEEGKVFEAKQEISKYEDDDGNPQTDRSKWVVITGSIPEDLRIKIRDL